MRSQASKILLSIFAVFMLANTACSQTSHSADDDNGGSAGGTSAISVLPFPITVPVNGSQIITAAGGTGPYTFTITTTIGGTLSTPIGTSTTFSAGSTAGVVQLTVRDSVGQSGLFIITVTNGGTSGGTLTISPTNPTMQASGNQTFTASGGTSPYTYQVLSANGGSFTANVYFAPATAGTYVIQASDSAGHTVTTTVKVVTAPSACSGYFSINVSGYPGSLMLQSDASGNISGILNLGGSTANVYGYCQSGYITFTNSYSQSTFTGNYFVQSNGYVYMAGTYQYSGGVYSWSANN